MSIVSTEPRLPPIDNAFITAFFGVYIGNQIELKHTGQQARYNGILPGDADTAPLLKIFRDDLSLPYIEADEVWILLKPYEDMPAMQTMTYGVIMSRLMAVDMKNNKWTQVAGSNYWTYTPVDFLRANGYATPFMGYTVKELVAAGLVKLEK